MIDPISFFLFFLVVVPLVLIFFQNKRKTDKEMIDQLKETNRMLADINTKLNK
jgi:ABC-type sulfate transport system permease subunit